MDAQQKAGAVQLSARLRGVSPPVARRLLVSEQASLAQLHAVLQVAFGWGDEHLYTFQIRGWQFGDPPARSSWRSPAAVSTFRSRHLLLRSMKRSGTSTTYSSLGRLTAGSRPAAWSQLRSLRASPHKVILPVKTSVAQRPIPSGWRAPARHGRFISDRGAAQ
jgi:Plasmid pRiA4b ORF-3-like protein